MAVNTSDKTLSEGRLGISDSSEVESANFLSKGPGGEYDRGFAGHMWSLSLIPFSPYF